MVPLVDRRGRLVAAPLVVALLVLEGELALEQPPLFGGVQTRDVEEIIAGLVECVFYRCGSSSSAANSSIRSIPPTASTSSAFALTSSFRRACVSRKTE